MSDKISSEFSVQICLLLDQASDKIFHCLDQLDHGQIWWRPEKNLSSIGNLLLHICGNLRQWCISPLSGIEFDRDRESEFTTITMDRDELIQLIQNTTNDAKQAIHRVQADQLLNSIMIQGFRVNLMNALLHTATHFQGHTHQVIYLTRLQKKEDYRFHWSPDFKRDRVPM